MADESESEQRQLLATFVTTEHAALQTARSATIFEATGRVTSYVAALSSTLIALTFIGQVAGIGTTPFRAFSLVLFPVLYFLGLVTFFRAMQNTIEDLYYEAQICRLRRFYFDAAPEARRYLSPVSGLFDASAPLTSMFLGRWQMLLTIGGMVGVINSVIAGSLAALLGIWFGGWAIGGGLALGVVVFLVNEVAYFRWQEHAGERLQRWTAELASGDGADETEDR